LFGLFFAIDNRFQNINVDLFWIVAILAALASALWYYVMRKDLVDKLVLGGLAAVMVAVALIAWIGTAAAGGFGLFAALWESVKVPSQLIQSLPYVLVVVVLAGFVGKAIPPRAGGQPYVKER